MTIWLFVAFLIFIGLLFFLIEVVTPHGILGILGGICILGAIFIAYKEGDAFTGTIVLIVTGIAAVATVIIGLRVMPNTAIGRKFILTKNQEKEEGYTAAADVEQEDLVGMEGVADSYLRPVGIGVFGRRRVDVIADGEYIPKGTRIKVVEVQSNRVIVRRV